MMNSDGKSRHPPTSSYSSSTSMTHQGYPLGNGCHVHSPHRGDTTVTMGTTRGTKIAHRHWFVILCISGCLCCLQKGRCRSWTPKCTSIGYEMKIRLMRKKMRFILYIHNELRLGIDHDINHEEDWCEFTQHMNRIHGKHMIILWIMKISVLKKKILPPSENIYISKTFSLGLQVLIKQSSAHLINLSRWRERMLRIKDHFSVSKAARGAWFVAVNHVALNWLSPLAHQDKPRPPCFSN